LHGTSKKYQINSKCANQTNPFDFRRILHALHLPIHIREVCVFIIPWMASNTTLAAYFLASEVKV
jgi:hypothetical protein